ncbi:hypothetical protein D9M68_712250 [compost metagenome]
MTGFFRPVILATAPSGDRLPFRMARWPSSYIGLSIGRITSWSARGTSGTSLSTSAMVWPLMVMQSPCSRPALSSTFITCGMPPAWCRSTARYLPEGFRSQITGTFLRMRSKSSMDHSTPAACAMARKCSTALVEPPVAMMTATAFSMAFLVTMSRGFRSFLMASISTLADSLAELAFSSCGFAMVDE